MLFFSMVLLRSSISLLLTRADFCAQPPHRFDLSQSSSLVQCVACCHAGPDGDGDGDGDRMMTDARMLSVQELIEPWFIELVSSLWE
jgi:hypothetical protein